MNNFINLAHLKFFCDTIECNSMSEAALKNFVTQSAISQAINKLEAYFGTSLLGSNKQKLKLTEEGAIVYAQAVEIFKVVKETSAKINQVEKEVTGVVRITSGKSLGLSFFPPTYKKCQAQYPQIDVKLKMGSRRAIRDMLKRDEVDFAIVINDDSFNQFAKHSIKKGTFNLYQSETAPQNQIEQGIFILEEKGAYIQELNEYLLSHDYAYKTKALESWELTAHFTNSGIGVGFFPDFLASKERFPNLKPHSINLPPFEYEMIAIYNKSSKLSPASYAFIEQFSLE